MSLVGCIEKTRQGEGVRYKFRGIDDLYLALQKLLAEHGVFFVPKVLESSREERQSKGGATITFTVLKVEFTFYASDASYFTCVVPGEAMDSSDKSCNKAMSAALKIALLQIFCIPTEEPKDTEEDHHEVKPKDSVRGAAQTSETKKRAADPKPSKLQLAQLFELADKKGWTQEDVRDYLSKMGLKGTHELNWFQYEALMKNINQYPRNGAT
jgi:hypothetical protein